jgi:Aspartate racemase
MRGKAAAWSMRTGEGHVRKLGIIGGTSWSSTALYYEHINRGSPSGLAACTARGW